MARLVLFLLAITTISTQARIGETLAQCEARYGPSVEKRKVKLKDSDPDSYVFSKNGITIEAEFHGGTVWKISYAKAGMDATELNTLLAVNAGEGSWSAPLNVTGQEMRVNNDHTRIAIYTPGKRIEATYVLAVTTADYAKANRKDYEGKLSAVPAILKQRSENRPLKDF